MATDASKPNIVRGIPVPLIRPLPTFYYYGRYATQNGSFEALKRFNSSATYFADSVKILASETNDKRFLDIADLATQFNLSDMMSIIDHVIKITTGLSDLCVAHSDLLKGNPALSKENFAEGYKSTVGPLRIILIDNNSEYERIAKLKETFINTCYFDVAISSLYADSFIDRVNACDFIVFASAYPITINEDVKNVHTYNKPCLIIANLIKDKKFDQQTIRNGNWLQRRGYEVLYKIFTPLRLFTTIEKLYMKFQFQND